MPRYTRTCASRGPRVQLRTRAACCWAAAAAAKAPSTAGSIGTPCSGSPLICSAASAASGGPPVRATAPTIYATAAKSAMNHAPDQAVSALAIHPKASNDVSCAECTFSDVQSPRQVTLWRVVCSLRVRTCGRGDEGRQLGRQLRRRLEGAAAAGAQQRHRGGRRGRQRPAQRLLQGAPGGRSDATRRAGRLPCIDRAEAHITQCRCLFQCMLPCFREHLSGAHCNGCYKGGHGYCPATCWPEL
jgi:hypothetical protein